MLFADRGGTAERQQPIAERRHDPRGWRDRRIIGAFDGDTDEKLDWRIAGKFAW